MSRSFPEGPELYCITDGVICGLSHLEQVEAMLKGGAKIIQLRDKSLSDDKYTAVAKQCLALTKPAGALLFLNDRVHLVHSADADGVHIGQDDLSPAEARKLIGEDKFLGLSTHNHEQFKRGLEAPVDYLAVGPVYMTKTKKNPDPVIGVDGVKEILASSGGTLPQVVFIGGLNESRVRELKNLFPAGVFAVIGGIVGRGLVHENVSRFKAILTDQD